MSNENQQENPAPLKRDDDGETHINVWSRGRTELGQALSNFAHTPFQIHTFGTFASVEAFWFWLATGKTDNQLRRLYGGSARRVGKQKVAEYTGERMDDEEFRDCIRKAIRCKLEQHDKLREAFINSTLPFEHYYVYGKDMNVIVDKREKHGWQTEYLEQLRDEWRAERGWPPASTVHEPLHKRPKAKPAPTPPANTGDYQDVF